MPESLGPVLERESHSVHLSEDAFDRMLRRRDRKRRRQRIGAAVTALTVAALTIGTLIRAFDRSAELPADRITQQTVGSLRVAWSAGLPGSSENAWLPTRPVTDGQAVFVGSASSLYAFPAQCANDGGECAPSWTADLGGLSDEIAVGDGQVVALVGDRLLSFASLCGIGRATCEPTWTATLNRDPRFSTSVDLQAEAGVVVATTVWEGTERIVAFSLTCGTGGARCRPLFDLPADPLRGSSVDGHAALASDGSWFIAPGRDSTVRAFPLTCPPGGPGCVPTWKWSSSDGASPSVLGVDNGLLFVTLSSRGAGFRTIFHHRTIAFPTSCDSPCRPVWSAEGMGFLSDGYLYLVFTRKDGPITVFSTACVAGTASCAPAWTATADERGLGFTDGSGGALALGRQVRYEPAVVDVYPASCVGATTPCLPSVLDTGFSSPYPPFVQLVGDVVFASSYLYEAGGSVVAYGADCGSQEPCPSLWNHRFGVSEYVLGPVLMTPEDTSIFVVTADAEEARLYALAP